MASLLQTAAAASDAAKPAVLSAIDKIRSTLPRPYSTMWMNASVLLEMLAWEFLCKRERKTKTKTNNPTRMYFASSRPAAALCASYHHATGHE